MIKVSKQTVAKESQVVLSAERRKLTQATFVQELGCQVQKAIKVGVSERLLGLQRTRGTLSTRVLMSQSVL